MIGVKRVGFASEQRLNKYLGVTTGCVSPFGLLNDTDHEVVVILNKKLQGEMRLGLHPNENTTTLWIIWSDLIRMLEDLGNPFRIVEM